MTKTTTQPSSAARTRLKALPGLRALLLELDLWADLEAELADCMPPRYSSPVPNRQQRRAAGIYFDIEEVRRYLVFCKKLRHIKGRWAGRKLIPDLWQVLWVDAPLFGWRRRDGNRLYSTLFEEIPRKNGKSTSCAGKALYLLMADSNLKQGRLAEPGAEVYAAASTTRQAKEVFRPAEQMARRSPSIGARLAIVKDKELIYERTASRFEVLSGVSDKAEEKMGLNPSGNIIDELHVHKSRKLVDTLESGTAAREQPLTVYITTAGVDDPGSIYTEKRDYAEKVAKGDLVDESWLVCIYTIDDGDDPFVEATWRKANPGLGRSVQLGYLERKAREAKNSPAALNSFLRLHLNVRTGQVTRWIPLEPWDESGAIRAVPPDAELQGRKAYGGLDLSSSVDLTAAAFVVPSWEPDPEEPDHLIEVLDVVLRAWTPAGTLEARSIRDRAPYQRWVDEGYLLTSPGEVVDYDQVELGVFEVAELLELERLGFDRWGSKQIITHMRDGGIRVFETGQGWRDMSPAMKLVERLILERRIRHGGNPLLRWAFGSLAVAQDPAGNVKPDRDKSTGRIDPFVALVMAVDAWSRETTGESVYEERGLVTA
jgi:phage terminase large subunit-like protein